MLDLVNFVFTDKKPPHPAFNNKLQLWRNLSELSADRYGFIASPNLDTVVTCFFKIASGMDSSRISFSPDAYLKETEETLAYFQSQPYSVLGSHPINPVRIKALQLFSQSQLFKELQNDEPLTEDDELHKNIDDLTEILTSLYESELDINIAIFAAIAGMYVATSDGEVSPEELDQIIHSLSSTNIYPRRFLDTILAQENPEDILASTTAKILEESPSIYPHLIAYLTQVAIADKHLRQEELDLIYSMSDALMGVSRRETAQIIGNVIADDFVPRLYAE
jgi:uncharacterized tellurite resistance protein B-like protein